jgi:phage gpG-like protein
MLVDEQTCPQQIDALRRMTTQQRWDAARQLYWTMRRHKAAFMQSQHPEWSKERVLAEVRQIFLHART